MKTLRLVFLLLCLVIAGINFPTAHGWYTGTTTWWDVICPVLLGWLGVLTLRRPKPTRCRCAHCGYIQEPEPLPDDYL